ncbi:Mis6-domain-containing protein [Pleomassaria siparia CBS 279.74]|uniref:Mis6-domain-containing protein n=1 Tax=Pleomassaria siparia CBS 279.74 TaxID=1314801 RepID=A0A6G1KFD0_9PLEO|nr:Mis6-domain-containing protein [Pleomassaria siparia CBS 279.74]
MMASFTDAEERSENIRDLVDALERASVTPTKQRTVKVSTIVDAICRHAFDHGLDQDALRRVVQVASRKTELDQTSVTTLIKNLYPSQQVPAHVVVTVVGGLGQGKGKPSPGTQNGLVKWLTMVRDIIEHHAILSRMYRVLFNMLDMISIRTSLCHLLSLITRRKHVQPFRIQQLLALSRGLGNEPALQGLLRVYRDYYPDIMIGSTSITRNSFPPQLDPEWQIRLIVIKETSIAARALNSEQHNGFRVARKGAKRGRASLIPDVHTFHANETSVTLEEIDSVEDFVDKLDRIELPGQLISILTDPLLQKFVALKPSVIATTRIQLWLSAFLEDEYKTAKSGNPTSTFLSEILDGLLEQTQYTKVLLPVVSDFLSEYLRVWDGISDVDAILGLLSFVSLQNFKDAHNTYFSKVEQAVVTQNPQNYERIIPFYTDVLRQWMNEASSKQPPPQNQFALSTGSQKMVNDLVTHVTNMSLSLIISVPQGSHLSLVSSILSFYELVSSSSKPNHIPIMLPSLYLTYLLVQDTSTTTLSRICGVIGNYKNAFDKHPVPIKDYYDPGMTNIFNWCLRDMFHLLWIPRALSFTTGKCIGMYCDPQLRHALNIYLGDLGRDYSIGPSFGIAVNPWLSSLSAITWMELEEVEVRKQGLDSDTVARHQGPISRLSLAALEKDGGITVGLDEYKVNVLLYLAKRGHGGIKELMFATASDLKKAVNPTRQA